MSVIAKSYENKGDPVIDYCSALTVVQNPLQVELQKETLEHAEMSIMLGAPEILTIGSHFLQLIRGKRVLDVGTFTGASALAWALAIPDDGKVYALDISFENYKKHGLPIIGKCPLTRSKIETVKGPALDSLGGMNFDFTD